MMEMKLICQVPMIAMVCVLKLSHLIFIATLRLLLSPFHTKQFNNLSKVPMTSKHNSGGLNQGLIETQPLLAFSFPQNDFHVIRTRA